MVESQSSKLITRVRFPSSAPLFEIRFLFYIFSYILFCSVFFIAFLIFPFIHHEFAIYLHIKGHKEFIVD